MGSSHFVDIDGYAVSILQIAGMGLSLSDPREQRVGELERVLMQVIITEEAESPPHSCVYMEMWHDG
jgi:hypothetical protein